jgi:tetratricopeptide (TPR) repeat protein
VKWFDAAGKTANLGTTKAAVFTALADAYCAIGRSDEALSTIKKVCAAYPRLMDAQETLAAWQLWFGKKTGYETTRNSMVRSVTPDDIPSVAQAAAKVYCLEPSSDAKLLARTRELAQHALELRASGPGAAWYRLTLGMAQYRSGQYDAAEQELAAAEQTAGTFRDILPTARLFRAMCLFQQKKPAEARQLFSQTEAQMTPLPADPAKPVIGGEATPHDVIITWLAYREAKSLLQEAEPLADRAH